MPPSAPPPELRDHLALALVPGLGPKLTRALLNRFNTPTAALNATVAELESIELIGAVRAARFAKSFQTVDVNVEWALIEKHGVRVVPFHDPAYPARLTTVADPPPLLYLRGELPADNGNRIAIVGSRACTNYGKKVTERLASGLATAGWTVVSGLARGIDGIAHRAALNAGGPTVAVLAGGLSKIYPPEHTDLAEQITKQGAILTETPMTVAPERGMFPARNRIVSGLCRAVVIVEANATSGALITAEHAAEQGREVFVVPGNVDSNESAGCLALIRKGARLVRSVDDILDDLRGIAPPDPPAPRSPAPKAAPEPVAVPTNLDPVQQRIWDALDGPRHADELARELDLSAAELSVLLTKLQLKKVIRQLPGNHFERRA